MKSLVFESCVDSLDAALSAASGGAGRIELCASLDLKGTTPDLDLVSQCVAAVSVPVFVMIRPRAGDFVYDAGEVATMERQARAAIAAGASGIVTGALRPDGTIDDRTIRRLFDAVHPVPVTYHRAIDATPDPVRVLAALIETGIARVLTSGGAPTALEGTNTIATLVARAGDAITIIAGGNVRAHNVAEIMRRTGVTEVHARVSRSDEVAALIRSASASHSLRS